MESGIAYGKSEPILRLHMLTRPVLSEHIYVQRSVATYRQGSPFRAIRRQYMTMSLYVASIDISYFPYIEWCGLIYWGVTIKLSSRTVRVNILITTTIEPQMRYKKEAFDHLGSVCVCGDLILLPEIWNELSWTSAAKQASNSCCASRTLSHVEQMRVIYGVWVAFGFHLEESSQLSVGFNVAWKLTSERRPV